MNKLRRTICQVRACSAKPGTKKYPRFCPSAWGSPALAEAEEIYTIDPEIKKLALAAARTEAIGYMQDTRLEDTIAFAQRIGAKHLGIANCVGLMREAIILEEILTKRGFKVSAVCCKVGSIDKEKIGLRDEEKVRPGRYEALCNPIGQAKLLNEAQTDLNIAVGLCVGHDSLFFKYSQAPITVLVAKDRVLAHNPAAALYLSDSYYRRLRE